MRIPITGILATVCTALGIYTLCWYYSLTKAERDEADRLACEYAMRLYGKGLDQLSSGQMGKVYDLVKANFAA